MGPTCLLISQLQLKSGDGEAVLTRGAGKGPTRIVGKVTVTLPYRRSREGLCRPLGPLGEKKGANGRRHAARIEKMLEGVALCVCVRNNEVVA